MPPGVQLVDVPVPEQWGEWPPEARINYLASTMDREQLLALAGEAADIPSEQIGAQSFLKAGLAQLVVRLDACTCEKSGLEVEG